MKIALLSGSDSRKSGGLYTSVRRLAQSTRKMGVDSRILAHRDEYSAHDSNSYGSHQPISYIIRGPATFGYSPDLSAILKKFKPDIIHTQCIWMYLSKVSLQHCRRFNTPHLISPRGMLDLWAVQHSTWKKKLVAAWFENQHLRTAACLHALCQSEADAMRQYGLTNPIAIIPNGIDLPSSDAEVVPDPTWSSSIPTDKKVLLFLGRIHPKKGLKSLIEAWSISQAVIKDWYLVIAGWDENGHRAKLEALVKSKGLEETILFVGSQLGKDKIASYTRADAFILPSLSEGLPMSVLEAWSYQLPVLMTPQCNLPEGFKANAALCFESTPEGNWQVLQNLINLSQSQLAELGSNGYQLVQKKFTWEKVSEQMAEVYAWVLAEKRKPNFIISN